MKHFTSLLLTGLITLGISSCNDDITKAGSSLVQDEIEIIMDSSFTITAQTVDALPIQSRTTMQQLGRLDAGLLGSYSASVITQFMPVSTIDTALIQANAIDSVKMVLRMKKGAFTGDSIIPMGLQVYPLTRQITSPIYSDFNPTDYYDPKPIASATYSATIGKDDSTFVTGSSIYKDIYVDMPVELGKTIFNKYLENPEIFRTPQQFAQWFPGMYITTSFGSGRIINVTANTLKVYYHTHPDSVDVPGTATFLGVTPEVISNNCISLNPSETLINDVNGNASLVAGPCGYNMEVNFPARDIINTYKNKTGALALVNSLSLILPAKPYKSDYNLKAPEYLLFVKKDKVSEFFANNSLPDGKTSFYATYDNYLGQYVFSDMRGYIVDLLDKSEITDEDQAFILMPVNVSFYNSGTNNYSNYNYYNSYLSYYYGFQQSYNNSEANPTKSINEIIPFLQAPVMAKFDMKKAKILFTFSKQTIKF